MRKRGIAGHHDEGRLLDVIEKAIRNAFEKGDASDQAFRERVYRQAFAALDRVLQANPGVTVESAIKRRKSLQAKIVDIEQEYVRPREAPASDPLLVNVPPLPVEPQQPAPRVSHTPDPEVEPARPEPVRPAPTVESSPEVEATIVTVEPVRRAPEPQVEPAIDEQPARLEPVAPEVAVAGDESYSEPSVEPVIPVAERRAPPDSPEGEVLASERVVAGRERRRRPMAAMFVAVTLFSILAIGIWWAMQTGLLGNTTQSEPVTTTQPPGSEDFEPGADEPPVAPGQADAGRNWIPVFSGNDTNAISAPSDTSAEAMHEEGADFVRVRSGGTGAAVMIDVNPGVLEQIAGKRATFDIVAKAEEGQDTQMSVTCNFGELGDCGRKRYAVGNARSDFLFEIDIPAKKPGAAGTIAINSDFDNQGKSVDIYEIKVSVSD